MYQRKTIIIAIASVWVIGCYFLLKEMAFFALTPGEGSGIYSWPQSSQLQPSQSKPQLLVFIHPQCSCSRATLANIKDLLKEVSPNQLDLQVVFYNPVKQKLGWDQSPIVKEAQKMALNIFFDNEGVEFRNFEARTSGQSFFFSKDRRLILKGGLTDERGHAGDSVGISFIADYLTQPAEKRQVASAANDQEVSVKELPSYGCKSMDSL